MNDSQNSLLLNTIARKASRRQGSKLSNGEAKRGEVVGWNVVEAGGAMEKLRCKLVLLIFLSSYEELLEDKTQYRLTTTANVLVAHV
ncbi:hypothetical protein OIU84_016441 [Salix udensis]|uniref:Uncharacterized protein n=1 Tax=Salix udensis TaxID=889485 RepID=A0AAD6JA05_9ROSI|nr:hypothetical protein OIU84_016441 [Salix udensis]